VTGTPACEHAVQPPEAGAGAVFVDRFHVPMALARPGLRAGDFREERLGRRIAVQDRVLAAFLVVENKLDADVGAVGPLRIGRVRPVAAHVADISLGFGHCLSCFWRSRPVVQTSKGMGGDSPGKF
jgi:hypothetical protein